MEVVKEDAQLVAEFRNKSETAFEQLIERYSDKAYSLALRMTGSAEDAEEVLQDVFTTVFRKIDGFEGKSSFSSWLYRVTVNSSLMKLRKRKQERSVHLEDALPNVAETLSVTREQGGEIDHITLRHQISAALERAIARLPEEYRPVFVLRDIDGLSSREVGKILNISIPAVKSRLHRSRLMLRRRLAPLYREYSEEGDQPRRVNER